MDHYGARWIGELPDGLAAQRELLRGLLAFARADADVTWLVVGCSLARGAGDRLSDIDGALGVDESRFDSVFPRVRSAVDGLGELVESFHHKLPGLTLTHERVFAQYADRSQLDLVVYPSTAFAGRNPDVVVLYDPDGLVDSAAAPAPAPVSPAQVREWAFLGWCALADLGKYVRRGSAWEALERLHEARAQLWQLWAAARGVPQPQYGLTSVLDYFGGLPDGIEETVSDLDPGHLLAAGLRVAELLGSVGSSPGSLGSIGEPPGSLGSLGESPGSPGESLGSLAESLGSLGEEQRAALPAAMGRFVVRDLRAAAADLPGVAG